ncbi:MAG: LysM peptidoglycan-binding domain-containing protein [Firmicutes bacterium]|nr:LysM peptidoglycan-binding domain-containing protein [Bacillota bacterium]
MSITCQYYDFESSVSPEPITRQVTVEAKLDLPQEALYPELIIGGDFQVGPLTTTIQEGALLASGKIYPQMLYVTGDSPLPVSETGQEDALERYSPRENSYTWPTDQGIPFEEQVEVPGLNPKMMARVEITPISAIYEPGGLGRINFQGKLSLRITPLFIQRNQVVSGLTAPAPEKLNILKEQIAVEVAEGLKEAQYPIQSTLLIPNNKPGIYRILKHLITPTGLSWETNRGKLSIRGNLNHSLIYIGGDDEGRPTQIYANHWNQETGMAVPFEVHLESAQIDQGHRIAPSVATGDFTVERRSYREIQCRINLLVSVIITKTIQPEIVCEVNSNAGDLIDIQKSPLTLEEYNGEATGDLAIDLTLDLPFSQPGIERLLAYEGRLISAEAEATEQTVAVKGGLSCTLFYMAEGFDSPRFMMARLESDSQRGIPVTGMIDFPGLASEARLEPQLQLENLQLEMMGSRSLKLTGTVKAKVTARTPRFMSILKDCALVLPVDPATRPSMLFYIVQPEDTLWKIARRYQTTVNALVRVNQLANSDQLETGQKLLIPKQAG